MELLIAKEDLQYAIAAVERAVGNKNTLPVLGGVLITAAGGQACFRATDLELAMECTVNAEVREEGEAVIPGRRFAAIVRLLPGGSITISGGEDQVILRYRGGEQRLPCFDASEFPMLPSRQGELEGSIAARLFRRLVRQVGIAAASDEVRPVFTGVMTELTPERLSMVATDTHRLARGSGSWQGSGSGSLLIPNRTLQEVARLAVNDEDDILFSAGRNQVYFRFANLTVTSRLIMGQHPDYHAVIPDESAWCSELCAPRLPMIEALERAALLVRDGGRLRGNIVRLELSADGLRLAAEAPELGNLYEELEGTVSGEPLQISYNVRYLLDALKALEGERVRMRLSGKTTPGLVLPDTETEAGAETDFLYLLLPVRINR